MAVNPHKAARLRAMKGVERIAALTAYDFPMAVILDRAEIPLLLVGDSLGMVTLGYPDTTHVTIEDMEHHVRAVARAQPKALVAADLPYQSFSSRERALDNARRLVAAGAEAVKGEGGREIAGHVRALVDAGIPFLGHIGMLPQNAVIEGGYHIKGKVPAEREQLLADGAALAEAGAFGMVLELVAPAVAAEVTRAVPIPTIGIGAGPGCDGEILVTLDLFGFSDFIPKHVKQHWPFGEQMRAAAAAWKQGVTGARKDA
ncbi:MAG TPA: 3-methyl-2-oxobutanoate hydroxymethyltransferase [Verrucomicrobiae bacterium]|jgi:3-methyl-2-oxobutanoate hydroxymethyltransferase|nr:3-methyl-2-oxobutanoate hydroxymethyltransferase [Verrucomicrobiae bacterium]